MFIHPSRFQDPHEQYETWIKFLRDDWRSVLAEAPTSKERRALLEEFRVDYDDLARTAALRDFDDLVPHLHTALGRINVQVVNGKNPDEVRWKTAYPWVLIGGQSLDRGFTVEGLTVSYIPRPIGEGNADNFQQRARFFGYRKPYLDISRVYMDQPSQRAFTNYVEHEETMRAELLEVQRTGSSLKEWKRVFLLDERLKPTRTSVIANGYLRTTIRGWQYPKWPSIDGDRVVQNNLAIDRIKNALTFEPLAGYTRHGVVEGVPVSWLLESLWAIEYAAGQDSRMHTATMLALRKLVDDAPDAVATVYLMDNFRSRVRTTRDDKNGEINPMQGRSPAGSDRYPGDEKVRDEENVSIQLHNIEVVTLQGAVPAVGLAAIRLPKSAVKSFVQQP